MSEIIKHMQPIRASVEINLPAKDAFAFALNPHNTPKWVEPIVHEEASEWPAKVGTVYRSQRKSGEWSELEVVALESDRAFTLSQKGGDFYVKYVFVPLDSHKAELLYELPGNSNFSESFVRELLDSFKRAAESAEEI